MLKNFLSAKEIVSLNSSTICQSDESVILFRLATLWFALPVTFLKEILPLKNIHSIPHKTNTIFQGIVNVNGELKLCASLHALFEVSPEQEINADFKSQDLFNIAKKRMVLIVNSTDTWCFTADQIEGIHSLFGKEIISVDSALIKQLDLVKAMFMFDQLNVNLLDADLLFEALNRSLL